jgi:hypothetical protein
MYSNNMISTPSGLYHPGLLWEVTKSTHQVCLCDPHIAPHVHGLVYFVDVVYQSTVCKYVESGATVQYQCWFSHSMGANVTTPACWVSMSTAYASLYISYKKSSSLLTKNWVIYLELCIIICFFLSMHTILGWNLTGWFIRGAKNACLSEWHCHPVFLIGN